MKDSASCDDPLAGERLVDRLFIGAGAMKAGTTWLSVVLDRHPGISFTPVKEINYFYARTLSPEKLSDRARMETFRRKMLAADPDRERIEAARRRLAWFARYLDGPVDDAWYGGLFADRPEGAYAADFSNLYAHLPEGAWRRIAAQCGELRVLYTMRDPVKRLWSHVKFRLATQGRLDELAGWDRRRMKALLRQRTFWENAEYGAAVRRLRAALPDEALHFAFHEAIHADERGFLAGLEGFLGLPAFDYPETVLTRRVNTTTDVPMPPWFTGLVAKDVGRIAGELRREGLEPPDSWMLP